MSAMSTPTTTSQGTNPIYWIEVDDAHDWLLDDAEAVIAAIPEQAITELQELMDAALIRRLSRIAPGYDYRPARETTDPHNSPDQIAYVMEALDEDDWQADDYVDGAVQGWLDRYFPYKVREVTE